MNHGKSITIFLVDGNNNGVITGELSNWNGKIVKIPRELVVISKRPELSGPGIYFLFCTDTENGQDACYIGESENLQARLNQHILDFNSGKEKYYWQIVVAVCGSTLNKALIRYLENRMVEIGRDSKRYDILTKNTSRQVILREHEVASMEEFIDNTKTLLSALNYRILEPLEQKKINPSDTSGNILFMKTKKSCGVGFLTADNSFIVKKGSKLSPETTRTCPNAVLKSRAFLLGSKKISNWETKEDLLFPSSSHAASFLAGSSLSGPEAWKNKEGVSLKRLQATYTNDNQV